MMFFSGIILGTLMGGSIGFLICAGVTAGKREDKLDSNDGT